MTDMNKTSTATALLLTTALLTACGGSDSKSSADTAAKVEAKPVNIAFALQANGAPLGCGQEVVLGTANTKAKLADARFYISNAALVTKSGKQVAIALSKNTSQQDNLALVDLENGEASCSDRGSKGVYTTVSGTADINSADPVTGLSFDVGVPSALNHSDYAQAKAPLDIQSMAWSWQMGRKFLKVEVKPTAGVQVTVDGKANSKPVFNVHLGSTNCTGNPAAKQTVTCGSSNRMSVMLGDFDANTHMVAFDVAKLLAQSDVSKDLGGASGCMSGKADPECPSIFTQLGLDLSTGTALKNGTQTVFSAVKK